MTAKLTIDADTSWLDAFKVEHGSTHLLAMSRGKDALASWLILREHGFDVVPYYMYNVPDLEFIAESIDQIERYFGVHVIQVPHRGFLRRLDNLVYQPPWRIQLINEINPKVPTYSEIDDEVRRLSGRHDASFTALGTKACDSMNRRTTFIRHGHVRTSKDGRSTFFPVWNFRKSDVMGLLKRNNLPLPEEYKWFGCSLDGISARFLVPIMKHRPRDYRKILEWFPLAELEVSRELLRQQVKVIEQQEGTGEAASEGLEATSQ